MKPRMILLFLGVLLATMPALAQQSQEVVEVTGNSNPQADNFNHVKLQTVTANATFDFPIKNGMTGHQVTFKVPASISAISVQFLARLNSTTSYTSIGTSAALGGTITGSGTYHVGRIVVSGLTGSGTVDFDYYGRTASGALSGTDSTALADIVTNTDRTADAAEDTTPTGVFPQAPTSGGWDTLNATAADSATACTNSAQAVKAAAGSFGGFAMVNNPNTADSWVHLYNVAAASVTVGTTAPKMTFRLPGTASNSVAANIAEIAAGVPFSTAIAIACTSTAGGNGAPTNALELMVLYK